MDNCNGIILGFCDENNMLFDHLFLQFKNISEKYGWSIEIFNYCQVSGYQLKFCIVTSASEILSHGIEACIPCSAHTFQKNAAYFGM